MARAIDADAFVDMLMDMCEVAEKAGKTDVASFIANILTPYVRVFRTIDPIKHGKWIINSDGFYPYCSECGFRPERYMTRYCPGCGRRMDGE